MKGRDVGRRRADEQRAEHSCGERRLEAGRDRCGDAGRDRRGDVQPGQDVRRRGRERRPERDRGEHRAAAEAGAEREGVRAALREDDEEQHAGGRLRDERGDLGLPGEEHEIDGPVGHEPERDRDDTHEKTGHHQGELGRARDGTATRNAACRAATTTIATASASPAHQARSPISTVS